VNLSPPLRGGDEGEGANQNHPHLKSSPLKGEEDQVQKGIQ